MGFKKRSNLYLRDWESFCLLVHSPSAWKCLGLERVKARRWKPNQVPFISGREFNYLRSHHCISKNLELEPNLDNLVLLVGTLIGVFIAMPDAYPYWFNWRPPTFACKTGVWKGIQNLVTKTLKQPQEDVQVAGNWSLLCDPQQGASPVASRCRSLRPISWGQPHERPLVWTSQLSCCWIADR